MNTWARSKSLLEAGQLLSAYTASRDAFELIESAFFDPAMVSQLYFPEMHKYAVYLPLFLPIILSVLVSLVRMIKERKSRV